MTSSSSEEETSFDISSTQDNNFENYALSTLHVITHGQQVFPLSSTNTRFSYQPDEEGSALFDAVRGSSTGAIDRRNEIHPNCQQSGIDTLSVRESSSGTVDQIQENHQQCSIATQTDTSLSGIHISATDLALLQHSLQQIEQRFRAIDNILGKKH